MLSTKLKEAAGNGADATLYVDDVFSTYLYTGNGSTQTITNGIDLAGKGGMVWSKVRDAIGSHLLFDTARGGSGSSALLITNTSNAAQQADFPAGNGVQFNSNGVTLGSGGSLNGSGFNFTSWTFREAAKFFDVVTWTNTSSTTVTVNHNLGVVPGMVIVKRTNSTDSWMVRHRSLPTSDSMMFLNSTAANSTGWTGYSATATTLTYDTYGNIGDTYVAYLFAHDTSSTGIIQCGSFTTGSSGSGYIDLPFESQYVLMKRATGGISNWEIGDIYRGMPVSGNGANTKKLFPNLSSAETGTGAMYRTGMNRVEYDDGVGAGVVIYMAIRMPNKPPTTGTQVYIPLATTGQTTGTVQTTDFPVDFQFTGRGGGNWQWMDRLRGVNTTTTESVFCTLQSNLTAAESTSFSTTRNWGNTSYEISAGLTGNTRIYYNLKRAPGFFDEVCYTGTGSGVALNHNLTVIPQLAIYKARSAVSNWFGTYIINPLGGVNTAITALSLNSTSAATNFNASSFGAAGFTSTTFPSTGAYDYTGSNLPFDSGVTYVAYLFATLAGIQYINSYVGDGTTGRVINCGFSAGARFICIKATSTTGSWWVWDSARGITSTNDPALQLNSTAAEITSADAIDPSSSGFIVNQEATCSINASGVSYLVWAIA